MAESAKLDTSSKPAAALPVLLFGSQAELLKWLKAHHDKSSGVWLQFAKKGAETESVTYAEAVEIALCFGWIDGQKRAHDAQFWLQRFTPRTRKSIWSAINRDKALALIESGNMSAAGMRQVELARADGRWDAAYAPASTATVPDDFQIELDHNLPAKTFFESLDRTNRYAILFRIQTARKAETRAKKISQFVQMLERHEKIHP